MKSIKPHYLKTIVLSAICTCTLNSIAYAENTAALQGIKLGFGHDMGLGIALQKDKINGFVGNHGLAVDYKVVAEKLEASIPAQWYIGAGGFAQWDGDLGGRLPIGIEASFAKGFDAYAQIIPELKLVNDLGFGLGAGLAVRYQF